MKILILGGDKRELTIINELCKRYTVDVLGYNKLELDKDINKINIDDLEIGNYDVIIFPVNGVQDNYLLKTAFNDDEIYVDQSLLISSREDALIFTGVRTKCLDNILNTANRKIISLMDDNDIKKENSVPTVEGIIGDLVFNTPNTINKSNILVLGYGNVGKLLVDDLKFMGANVVVGIIEDGDYTYLKMKNIKGFYTDDVKSFRDSVKQSDIIINTVPQLMLNKEYLDLINSNTYILDISSFPYGVDTNYASSKGLNHKSFQGIPSVVAPKTSGLILFKKIDKMIGGDICKK